MGTIKKQTEYYAFPGDAIAVPGDPVARVEQYWPMRLTLKQDDLTKCPVLGSDGMTLIYDGVDDCLDKGGA